MDSLAHCILVVEDDKRSLGPLARLLRMHGYTVHTARDYQEGMALGKQERCNLVISDIGLPGGSGLLLMEQLKMMYGPKGIAVSGYTDQQAIEAALHAGFVRHLQKPFTFDQLLVAIREVLG